jgi:hypothetical protein
VKRFKLFTGVYELLDEADKYLDPKSDGYELPKEIDGKLVAGIDGEWVVGGNLICQEPDDLIEFDEPEDQALAQWIDQNDWSDAAQALGAVLL